MMHALVLLKRLFLPLILALFLCLLCAKLTSPALWWFGLPLCLVVWHYLNASVAAGVRAVQTLGRSRVLLNTRLAGRSHLPVFWPFQIRMFLAVLAFIAAAGYTFHRDIASGLTQIVNVLRREEGVLRIEYPSYAETPPFEAILRNQPIMAKADTGSYLQFFIRERKAVSAWTLTLTVQPEPNADQQSNNSSSAQSELTPEGTATPNDTATPIVTANGTPEATAAPKALVTRQLPLSATGSWAQSVSALMQQMGLPEQTPVTLILNATQKGRTGESAYRAVIKVAPIPVPLVTINPASQLPTAGLRQGGSNEAGRLLFEVAAKSQVPLTQVELAVRTKSGYRFNKTLAEFANSQESNFKTAEAELSTVGIPFSEDDILYVKAVAKTVLSGLQGESIEIEIPVKSRAAVRQQVTKALEDALKELKNPQGRDPGAFAESKARIEKALQEAKEASATLGRQSTTHRQTAEAAESAAQMQSKSDASAKKTEQKIQSALESLKREQSMERMSSLFARLQNLKTAIARVPEQELAKMAQEAGQLKEDAQALKDKLREVTQAPSSGLTPEEKQLAEHLLSADKTPEKIKEVQDKLASSQREQASAQTQQALEEAQKNLGSLMQIVMAARQRAIKDAREKLTQADTALEKSKNLDAKQATPGLSEAQQKLEALPSLGEEFNDAAGEARDGAREARKEAQSGKPQAMAEDIGKSQEGIVKALAALQDEEESDRQSQQEQDGRTFRSAMDAMAAQGQLDVGWRKKILEEIARLRTQGEAADSPVIRYLESRLR